MATTSGGERRVPCATCGKQIAAGVRYCIHCGAEQSVPTPIAAVAAALMARASEREAANAAHAEAAAGSDPPRVHDAASPATSARREAVAANAEPARPVYANGPGRRGLAIALIACCAVAAAALAAAVIWRIEGEPRATSVFETAGEAAPGTTRSAASASSAAEAPGPGETSTIATPAPAEPSAASMAANAETPPSANAPVEIKALPPHPGAPRASHPAPARQASPSPATPATQPGSEPAPAAVTPPPAKPKVAAVAPTASHVADRWQRLDEELSRCTREDFITRVICGQRVRFRYCDGYWGKVPACPGSPAPERGQ